MNRHTVILSACLLLVIGSLSISQATELVYTPVNPSFGGNPLNGSWLLNNAQSQNDHADSRARSGSTFTSTTALERFSSQLESRLLTQLLQDVQNGQTGSLVTGAFVVDIIDNDGELSIQVTDRATGEISEIIVSGF